MRDSAFCAIATASITTMTITTAININEVRTSFNERIQQLGLLECHLFLPAGECSRLTCLLALTTNNHHNNTR
jgi:hypothetical protein